MLVHVERRFQEAETVQAILRAPERPVVVRREAPIRLLVKEFDRYRTVAIDYHDGLRYPHLERIEGVPDRITPILAAK